MNMNFNYAEMVLFDSTIAQFKLSIKGTLTRDRNDGSTQNLIYKKSYTNQRTKKESVTLNMDPNVYLVFTYRGESYETSSSLYTSYPQLFGIRAAIEEVKDLLINPETFEEIEGILEVKPQFQNPYTIQNIGRDNSWISFSVATVEEIDAESNIKRKIPGATIWISESEYASPMTAEEFLTVYSIVKDIDLASIQMQLSMLAIQQDNDPSNAPAYSAPVSQAPSRRQPQFQQATPQQFNQQPTQQKFGNAPSRGTFKPRTAPPVSKFQPEEDLDSEPEQNYTKIQQPQRGNLPPRKSEKTIVNMKAVEETPSHNIDFNDPDALDSIFDDE